MKAIYQKPELEMTQLDVQPLMDGSLSEDGKSGDTEGASAGDAGGAAGNSSFSLWDDDNE